MATAAVPEPSELETNECSTCCGSSCNCCKFPAKVWCVIVGSSWGFLTNVERAIILPGLWLYLKTSWDLETAKLFYAVTIGAFCLAILIFTPLVGYLAKKGVRTQVLLLISNQLEILGNIMYLIGHSPWVLLVGRFISGVGACCDPPIYSDMVELTTKKERTAFIIGMLIPRQAGIIFGPVFTLATHNIDVRFGNLNINVYNAPGLIMAALWGLHCILILTAYPTIRRGSQGWRAQQGNLKFSDRVSQIFFNPPLTNQRDLEDVTVKDKSPILSNQEESIPEGEDKLSCAQSCRRECASLKVYLDPCLITLYGVTFMVNFCTLCLESVLPPVSIKLFNWTEIQVSYVYLVAGFAVIFAFLINRCLAIWLADRTILSMGLFILMASYLWLTCYLAYEPKPPVNAGIAIMMTGLALHVIGIPFAASTSDSLYTKIAPKHDMERAQSIFRTIMNLGYFAGPYVGGSLTSYGYIPFVIMTVLVFIPFIMICLLYGRFSRAITDKE